MIEVVACVFTGGEIKRWTGPISSNYEQGARNREVRRIIENP
jgi:hypothetical protein